VRIRAAAVAMLVVLAAPGCLVLALDRFYDEPAIIFDERLLGEWKKAEHKVTVKLERPEYGASSLK